MKKNNFIVVEGFDGSGKTSTAKWLEKELGYKYMKSPTGVFAQARELFDDIENVTIIERLAFYTGDCIRVSEILRETYKDDKVVLDRYYMSTVCYHEALCQESTKNLTETFNQLYQPDLVIYLMTDYDILNERLRSRENSLNDKLVTPEFYEKVGQQFNQYAKLPNFFVVDNNRTMAETQSQIKDILKCFENDNLLERGGLHRVDIV